MKTCERCGLVNPDSSARCECGGYLIPGDVPAVYLRNGSVAGFWIRVLADFIDVVALGVLGWILTLFLGDSLLSLGERGVFVGMAVSMLYTAVLHSRIGGGQTFGKRLLSLRVLRMDGSFLSLDRALVRWGLMGFLVYGTAAGYALAAILPFSSWELVSAAVTGVQLALFLGCGLLVPFHPLKRGLHDLLTGSIVVRRALPPEEVIARGDKPSRDGRLIAGAVLLAAAGAIASIVLAAQLRGEVSTIPRITDRMESLGLQHPSVVEQTIVAGGGRRRIVLLSGYLAAHGEGRIATAELHAKLAALARQELPMAGVDVLTTALRTGINIGIYSSYETSTENHLPVPTASPPQPDSGSAPSSP